MNLSELDGGEGNPTYSRMAESNLVRYYSFLDSAIDAALSLPSPWLSEPLIKVINFHAIVALHSTAGQYRHTPIVVSDAQGNTTYIPPRPECVPPLMGELIDKLKSKWESKGPVALAAYALWRINHIHPFVNGNGRSARAMCYYILCVKLEGMLPGGTAILERLRQEPERSSHYVPALEMAYKGDLAPLESLISSMLSELLQER